MWTLLLASLCAPAPAQTGVDSRPDVLVLVADDLSERDLDALDVPTLEALAARGLRFRRAYANPTCSPSRWSLHFGQYHALGAGAVCDGYGKQAAPSTAQPSLPRLFAEEGYRTALFGKWHLGSYPGVEQGEAWEDAPRRHGYDTWRAGLPANVNVCGGKHYTEWLRVDDGHSALSHEYVPDAIREAFLDWHAEVAAQRAPWFAMVCFQLPHAPLHEAPERERVPATDPAAPEGEPSRPLNKHEQFASMVHYLDATIAAMLAAVDLEHTLVVFVADNGSPRGAATREQDPDAMKMTTLEGGIRVPMIWAGPGVAVHAESEALVHLADLLPTFADLLGHALDADGLDGASLRPLFAAPGGSVHEYVWCGLGPNNTAPLGEFAVVTARYKLRRDGFRTELYDLERDPEEQVNLAGRTEHAELEQDLLAKLDRHLTPGQRDPLRPARERGKKRR